MTTETTPITRAGSLALANYLLWRRQQSAPPRGLGLAFVADFGATVGRLFDDGRFRIDAEHQAITGCINGHDLSITRRTVAGTSTLVWCVQTPPKGHHPWVMRTLSPAPPAVMQGQLVAYVVEVLQGHQLSEDTIDYDTLLSMRAHLRRTPPIVPAPTEPTEAFAHTCQMVFGPMFDDNPVWTVAYDDFLGLDGRQSMRALLTVTATSELFQLYYDREVGWILMSGIIADDPVGAAVLPRRSEPYGPFDALVLALDHLRRDRDPIATSVGRREEAR